MHWYSFIHLLCVLANDPGTSTYMHRIQSVFNGLGRHTLKNIDVMLCSSYQSCFVNKLTTSTKMNYLGGVV